MPKIGQHPAAANKEIRQKALREFLSKQKLVEKVIDIARELNDEVNEYDTGMITRKRAAADINCKLINKYLPDLKSTEITGDPDNPLEHSISISFVKPK